MALGAAVSVPLPLAVAPPGGEPLALPDAEGGAEGVALAAALREPPLLAVAGAVGCGEALAPSGEGVALLLPPPGGEAEGRGVGVTDAAPLALDAPLRDAGRAVGEAAAVREAPSPPDALGGALGEGGAEGEAPPPPLAEGAPEALPPPRAGEALLERLPLGEPPSDGVAAAASEGEGAPVKELAPSGEAVAAGLRLPACAEGVGGGEGDPFALGLAVPASAEAEAALGVGEGGADAVAAGVAVAEARCEGEPEGVSPPVRLPRGERDAEACAEGEAEAPAERVAAGCVGEAPPVAVGAGAEAVGAGEGAPEPLPECEGAAGEGEPERQPEAVAVAARGVAEGQLDTEGLPEWEGELAAVPEGGREGDGDGDCAPLRLAEGEPAALRDAEAAAEALPDGPAVREVEGDALAVREELLLALSPRAGEGVPVRLAAAPVGVTPPEGEGARDSDALPLCAPLGEAAADWEAEPEMERDCGGVREALPLRSCDGLPAAVAEKAAVGAPEGEPPSVAEPRPLGVAAPADSEGAAVALGGGEGDAAPLALPEALPLAAAGGEGVASAGVGEGYVEGLGSAVGVAASAGDGLASAEAEAAAPLEEGRTVGVGGSVASPLGEAAALGEARLDGAAEGVAASVPDPVPVPLGVPGLLASAEALEAGEAEGVAKGVALSSADAEGVPPLGECVTPAVAVPRGDAVSASDPVDKGADAVPDGDGVAGALCEGWGDEEALMVPQVDLVARGEALTGALKLAPSEALCEADAMGEAEGEGDAPKVGDAESVTVAAAEAVKARLPEGVTEGGGLPVGAGDAVVDSEARGVAERLAAGVPLGGALPDDDREAGVERDASGDADAEGQLVDEGLSGVVSVARSEVVGGKEGVGVAVPRVVSEGGAGEGEAVPLASAEALTLAEAPPGLNVERAEGAPDAEASRGVGVPLPLCASLVLAEAVAQLLAEALRDGKPEALDAAVALCVGDMEPPPAAVGDVVVEAGTEREGGAVAVCGGDAEAAAEGDAGCESDAAAEPLPKSDALVVSEALMVAEGGALADMVGEGPAHAVGVDMALLAAVAVTETVKAGEGVGEGEGNSVAVKEEVPLWQALASSDFEADAVTQKRLVAVLEPEWEGKGVGVPLGEPVPSGDPDGAAVALADTVKPPLGVPIADGEALAVGGAVPEGIARVAVAGGEPVARGVEEGQAVAGMEPDCEGEDAADFDPAAAVSDWIVVAVRCSEAVEKAVSDAEPAAVRDVEGEVDAVGGAESVVAGVHEAAGVRLVTTERDGPTLALEVTPLVPLGVGRALGVGCGDGVALADSVRPLERDGSEDSDTGAVVIAVDEAVTAAVEVSAILAVVVGETETKEAVGEGLGEKGAEALVRPDAVCCGDPVAPEEGDPSAGDMDANEAVGEGLGEKGAEALARPDAVCFGDPVAPEEGDTRAEGVAHRLANIVPEGEALTDCVGGLEALARGDEEAAPLPDPPAALREGEPDADAAAESEVEADGDTRLLPERAAEGVSATASEALCAAVLELLALLEGDLRGVLVAPPLPVGAAGEAVGLAEVVGLGGADGEAGKGDAVPEAHALPAPDALPPPPLAEAVDDGERGGVNETAPVGVAVGSTDAEAVGGEDGLTRSEGDGGADAVSIAGVDEVHPVALTVGVPAADSVCAPLLLSAALALGAPEALSRPVSDGRAENDSVCAGDSVALAVGEGSPLAVGALEGLPCAFAVALPCAVADRLGKLLGEGCRELDEVLDDDELRDWLPLGVTREEGGALGEPPRAGEAVPAPLLTEGPTEAEAAAMDTLGVPVLLKAADCEAAAEAEGAQLMLTRALPVTPAAVAEGSGVAQATAVLLGDTRLLLEALAAPVPLSAAEGEAAAEVDGTPVPLPRALLVTPAAESEGLGVALANKLPLADAQPLFDAAPVAVPAGLPLPSSDAVALGVVDVEAATLADALCAAEKVPPDAEGAKETLGKALGDAGTGEGDASMEGLGEGLPPPVPEGVPDTAGVPDTVWALVDVNESAGVAETLFEAPGEADAVGCPLAVGAPEPLAPALCEARGDIDREGLRDADGVVEVELVAERESAAVAEWDGEGDADGAGEPVLGGVLDAAGEHELEGEPVTLMEMGTEAVAEAQGLLGGDAVALHGADALPPAAAVALPRAVALRAPLAEAHGVALPVSDSDGDAVGGAVLGALSLADEVADGATGDGDALPLSVVKAVGEAVPRPAPAEPLPLGVPLAVALSETAAVVGVGPTEGVGGEVALAAFDSVPLQLLVLQGDADSHAEGVGVAGHPLGLAEMDADARALWVGSAPLGVSMPLAEAAEVALSAGDGEAPLVSEGGGERLSERLCMDDGDAAALPVPQCEAVARALSDGLCEGEREVGAEGEGCPDAEVGAVMEAEWHGHALAEGECDEDPLPLPRSLSLGLPVALAEGAAVLLPEALSLVEGVGRGEGEGVGDAQVVAVAQFVSVSRLDGVGAGEADALLSVLPEGSRERDGCPEALAPALGDVDPLSDAAGADGVAAPLAEARPVADGTPLKLAIVLGDADAEAAPGEGVPLLDGHTLGLHRVDGDAQLLSQAVPLLAALGVCEPRAVAQALPVRRPAEGEGEELGVPAPLPVLEGVFEAVPHAVRVGAAIVRVSVAVGEALATKDGEANTLGEVVGEGVRAGVIEGHSPVPLGLPESEPAPAEGVAKLEALAVLLAPPEADLGADAETDAEADVRVVSVARVEAEALEEAEALLDEEEAGLALRSAEGEGDAVAMEPLGHGEALLVSARVCDGVLLKSVVGLSAAVLVVDCSGVGESVPPMLPDGDALMRAVFVSASEGERALDEDAAAELEAPPEKDPMAVAEGVAGELCVERADHVA